MIRREAIRAGRSLTKLPSISTHACEKNGTLRQPTVNFAGIPCRRKTHIRAPERWMHLAVRTYITQAELNVPTICSTDLCDKMAFVGIRLNTDRTLENLPKSKIRSANKSANQPITKSMIAAVLDADCISRRWIVVVTRHPFKRSTIRQQKPSLD